MNSPYYHRYPDRSMLNNFLTDSALLIVTSHWLADKLFYLFYIVFCIKIKQANAMRI
jgi:hypothetical protein